MRVSTKHKGLDKDVAFTSFHGGYTKEREAPFLSKVQLSKCRNLRYIEGVDEAGNPVVTLKVRPGTTKITNTAVDTSTYGTVKAVTYYHNQSQYIMATATNIFYLDGSFDPQLIGTLDGIPTFTEFNNKLIIHDSGITKSWDGTTFDTLEDYYVGEIIETGDGAETEFAGTLTNPPIEPSTIDIDYTSTTSFSLTDSGTGRLEDDIDSTWVKAITGTSDNGSGNIRLVVTGHGFSTSDEINVEAVVGTTEANNTETNPTWTITSIDANTIDLQGSTWANAYVSGGTASKNTIIYSTGAYVFKASDAPDNATSVTAGYEKDDGAPKSKWGFVRGSSLWMGGDSDNASRLWYSGAHDEDAWNSTSSGGYLDVSRRDGQELVGALNFYTSVLCVKEDGLHRIDGFPGDASFLVEPIKDTSGGVAYRTVSFDSELVTFMSKSGLLAMSSSERFGDIQKAASLSIPFRRNAVRYANSHAYSAYNETDEQIWLALSGDGTTYLDDVYVIGLGTGGQFSEYRFEHGYTSFNYENEEMLISGTDGHLYKLDKTGTIFTDNDVAYTSNTFFRSGFYDSNAPFNKKHGKWISLEIYAGLGYTALLSLFKDRDYSSFYSATFSGGYSAEYIYDGDIDIFDMQNENIYQNPAANLNFRKRLNWKEIMWQLSDIYGVRGVEMRGITFKSALKGI